MCQILILILWCKIIHFEYFSNLWKRKTDFQLPLNCCYFTLFCKTPFTQAYSPQSIVTNKEGLMSLIPSFFCAFKQTKAHAFFLLFNSRKEGEPWQPRTRVRTDDRVADGILIPSNLLPPQSLYPPQFSITFLLRSAKTDNLSPTSPPFPSTKARSGTSREDSGSRGTMQLNTTISSRRERGEKATWQEG